MKYKFIILFLFLNCFLLSKAATVTGEVKYIDHEGLLIHNFNPTSYANYQQAFMDSITAFFHNSKEEQNVRIIQTLDPNLFPFYSFSAKPALHDTVRHALQKKLMSITPIVSRYLPFSSEIIFTINGGCKNRGLDYSPQITDPKKLHQSRYEHGNLEQDFNFLKDWIANGALPILKSMLNTNLKQQGVELTTEQRKAFATDSDGIDANYISSEVSSKRYWDVMRKLQPNDRSLIVFRIIELAFDGRIQYAQRGLQMIYQFEPNNTLLRYVMDEFNWRINYYLQKESAVLFSVSRSYNTDNTDHKNNDFEKLKKILEINPMSGNTLMRLFKLEFGIQYNIYPWAVERYNFEKSDPMQMDTLPAITRKEAYENALRGSTAEMFIDAETFDADFPKYAEIALKLHAYDFAADLYWMLENQAVENLDTDGREYRIRRIYAEYKLNSKTLINKRLKRIFKRLDKKFRKDMKRHPRYKKFKN